MKSMEEPLRGDPPAQWSDAKTGGAVPERPRAAVHPRRQAMTASTKKGSVDPTIGQFADAAPMPKIRMGIGASTSTAARMSHRLDVGRAARSTTRINPVSAAAMIGWTRFCQREPGPVNTARAAS